MQGWAQGKKTTWSEGNYCWRKYNIFIQKKKKTWIQIKTWGRPSMNMDSKEDTPSNNEKSRKDQVATEQGKKKGQATSFENINKRRRFETSYWYWQSRRKFETGKDRERR